MENIRNKFPVLRQSIYVNTPVFGPLYDDLYDWKQEFELDFLLKGSRMRNKSLETISDCRTIVGRYFNCKRENIALLNNFSTGLNMLLEGIDKKRKVLLLENDYPSVDWPFYKRGFDISYAKIDANLELNIKNAIVEEKVSILALSIVQWQNGILVDLEFLTQLKKEHPNLLIIADGTQFLGTTNFSFSDSAIDVLGVSAYKWLLAGYGSGFMLFKDDVERQCKLQTIGFNSADGMPEKKELIRFAKRFEPGHLAPMNFGSLKFSLEFFEGIGKDKIAAQNEKLGKIAKVEFSKLGLLQDMVVARNAHSTIFNIKGDQGKFDYLTENDVICTQRGDGIRLGFHFYNTEKDLNAILKLLKTRL